MIKAGRIMRGAILSRSPQMIADRKHHLRVYRCCMVGCEMVDWLMKHSAVVHSRTQAVCMWQVLLEEGIIIHGRFLALSDVVRQFMRFTDERFGSDR